MATEPSGSRRWTLFDGLRSVSPCRFESGWMFCLASAKFNGHGPRMRIARSPKTGETKHCRDEKGSAPNQLTNRFPTRIRFSLAMGLRPRSHFW